MPKILLYEPLTDPQTGYVYPAGKVLTLHPDSPVYKELIEKRKAENIIELPTEVPGYAYLKRAGIYTLQHLLGSVDQLEQIKGIGEKTADQIKMYIEKIKVSD